MPTFQMYGINVFSVFPRKNLTVLKNFDVFAFVRYYRDTMKFLRNNEYLITLQTGFQYKTGRSKFVVSDFGFRLTL